MNWVEYTHCWWLLFWKQRKIVEIFLQCLRILRLSRILVIILSGPVCCLVLVLNVFLFYFSVASFFFVFQHSETRGMRAQYLFSWKKFCLFCYFSHIFVFFTLLRFIMKMFHSIHTHTYKQQFFFFFVQENCAFLKTCAYIFFLSVPKFKVEMNFMEDISIWWTILHVFHDNFLAILYAHCK